jgi:hypothetical protein
LRFYTGKHGTGFPHFDIWSVPASFLFAAFEKRFPLFRRFSLHLVVDAGGKEGQAKVFQIPRTFSTSFPQLSVDAEGQY